MKIITGALSLVFKLYVGIIFASTLIILYPFLLVTLLRKDWKKYSFPINIFWSHVVRLLTFVQVWRIKSCKVPKGPYMIIANHASYFDIFLMYSLLPQHPFLFMGKSEILSYPLLKTFFKRLNIPVYRGDRMKAGKAFIQAKREIQAGWSIVVFPEGGIPDECPQMIPFKIGAFKLAKSAGIPIIPITFADNWHLFSDPGELLGPAHPGLSRIYVHEAITGEQVKAMTEEELSVLTFDIISKPLIEKGYMKKVDPDTGDDRC